MNMKTATIVALGLAAAAARGGGGVQPVPFTAVKLEGGFWGARLETNRTVTVPYDFKKCEETARIANFARAGGLEQGPFEGIPFNDSDVYKVIEGAAYSLALHPDPELDKYLDGVIAKIASAQEPDGYLYSARRLLPAEKMPGMSGRERWSNLGSSHELYNVGHLYEAAVAHFRATGKRTLLDVALKNADLICKVFGPADTQLHEPPGHEEIEIGLVSLHRATGEKKYLDQAKYFVELRGQEGTHRLRGAGQQDHKPIFEQDEAVGHAVRAGYFYTGAADVAALTGDAKLVSAIDRLWENVASKKLYLTGGIGARHGGEAFGDNYELPDETAYNETCAAIANALWNHRMFLLHGDAKYVDVLERTMFNGFLSGISMQGDTFFYPNPLSCRGGYHRQAWFGCSCCPVNVVRFIPSTLGYYYAVLGDDVYVNLFAPGTAAVKTPARTVSLSQETDYPWGGRVRIAVRPEPAGEFALRVRIPGWARNEPVPSDLYRYAGGAPAWSLKVNGEPARPALERGYAVVRRAWKAGDVVELDLPMPVRRVTANDALKTHEGLVAFERGPIVFCAEEPDNGGPVARLAVPDDAVFTAAHRPDLLNGVTVLTGRGLEAKRADDGKVAGAPVDVTLIPYYAWCHRGALSMAVWLPRDIAQAKAPPPPTIATRSRVTASHCHGADATDAVNDLVLPKNSGDHALPRFTWWDHRGTKEWIQYEFAKPARVKAVEVYWFDDTGRGSCRVPASWTLLRRDGGAWKPVAAKGEAGTTKDRFNRLEFDPVETDGLRIEAQLAPNMSGGILEWRVVAATE